MDKLKIYLLLIYIFFVIYEPNTEIFNKICNKLIVYLLIEEIENININLKV